MACFCTGVFCVRALMCGAVCTQTISLLSHLACSECVWGPHLIVVPTSTMLNWEMEFKRWAPGFKIMTYFGGIKERKAKRQVGCAEEWWGGGRQRDRACMSPPAWLLLPPCTFGPLARLTVCLIASLSPCVFVSLSLFFLSLCLSVSLSLCLCLSVSLYLCICVSSLCLFACCRWCFRLPAFLAQGWTKPNAFHVCITSYQLVVSDASVFRRKKWCVVRPAWPTPPVCGAWCAFSSA
jgi:SNF2 family DNA or RNA helicase